MGRSEFTKSLRSMTYAEVEGILSDKKMLVMKIRNNPKGEEYKNTGEWINTKKDVARCLTILSEKKKEELREESIREGKPLPKFLRPKTTRAERVNIPKSMLTKYRQNRAPIKRKIVVFTP